MKKVAFLFLLSITSFACNNQSSEKPATDPSAAISPVVEEVPLPSDIDYAYKATLASDWKLGNPEYSATVLKLYKALEDNLVDDSVLHYFADSITSISYDDRTFKGSSKQFLERVRAFRKQYKTLNEEFISFVPLHSSTADVDQVSIWIRERGIRTNGKPDSTVYQENWRFNDDGKIYFRSAYARYGF